MRGAWEAETWPTPGHAEPAVQFFAFQLVREIAVTQQYIHAKRLHAKRKLQMDLWSATVETGILA